MAALTGDEMCVALSEYLHPLDERGEIKAHAPRATLPSFIIAVPVLATDDAHLIENFVEQYSRQTLENFAIVFYPNASKAADPAGEAVADCGERIARAALKHPTMDIRVVKNPHPEETFTSIGKVRKYLWDAIAWQLLNDNINYPSSEAYKEDRERLMELAASEAILQESSIIPVFHLVSADRWVFNHDVDVETIPEDYLLNIAREIIYTQLHPGEKPSSYNSIIKHGFDPAHPHASQVAMVHDYLYMMARIGFEAGIVISLHDYLKVGGFSPEAVTYETAGLTERIPGWVAMVENEPLVTSGRRWVHLLPERSVSKLWGSRKDENIEDFSDGDGCRRSLALCNDVSLTRRDQLISDFLQSENLGVFFYRAVEFELIKKESHLFKALFASPSQLEALVEALSALDSEFEVCLPSHLEAFGTFLAGLDYGGVDAALEKVREEFSLLLWKNASEDKREEILASYISQDEGVSEHVEAV